MSLGEFILSIIVFCINPIAGALVFLGLLVYHKPVRR